MKGKPIIVASDAIQLDDVLRQFGQSAPDRLNRTGRKRELEEWILARWLAKRMAAGTLDFPVIVWHDENPDFFVKSGLESIGLEVTEAVDPEEQASWTQDAKEDQRSGIDQVRSIDSRWITGTRYSGLVYSAVERKAQKCSTECSHLLVYLNTHDDMFDQPCSVEQRLRSALTNQRRFECVWVLSDGELFCFSRTYETEPDHFERADAKPRDIEF